MSEDFSSENKSTIAFKKLFNKAHTSPSKALGNELIASNVSLADSTIFGETLPSDPESAPGTVVEKVTFTLVEDNTAAGHAWKLQFPSDYSGSLTGKADNFIHQYLGAVQLVPPTYGSAYTAKVKDSSNNELSFGNGAFFIDYYAGVFFQKVADQQAPHTVEAFVYTGKMLNQVVSDIQTSVDNSQDSLLAGSGISIAGSTISADVTAASFSALTSTVNSLPNSIESLNDVNLTSASLSEGQYLKWDNSESEWIAGNTSDFVTGVVSINNLDNPTGALTIDTDDIPEGAGSNKYATEANISAITFANALNTSIIGSSSKWTNGRKVTLSGDVIGAATLDGSQDVTITTTFAATLATQDYANSAATTAANIVKADLIGSSTLSTSLDTFKEIADFITDEAAAVDLLDAAILSKADKSTGITAGNGIVTAGSLGSGVTVSLGTLSGLPTDATGSSTKVPVITLDTHGRVTALTTANVSNFDGEYSSLTGVPSLATAASFNSLKTTVDARESILTIGDGLDLSAQGTLTANVTTIDGYVTSATFNVLKATVDARKDVQNVSGNLSFSGSTLSTSFDISDYATAAAFSSLQTAVNARVNTTSIGAGLALSNGELSTAVDLSTLATASTLSNYVLTATGNTAYANATTTASSLSALDGRLDTIEADYLTNESTLLGSKVSGSISGQAGTVASLAGHNITLAGNSVSLANGSISAVSLSDSLKTEMSQDILTIGDVAADSDLDAVSTRVTAIESDYLTSATTLSSAKLNNSGVTLAGLSVDLGGAIAASALSDALSSAMASDLSLNTYATSAALASGLAAKQDELSVAAGSKISLSDNVLNVDLSTYALSANYTTTTALTSLLGNKQDTLAYGIEDDDTVQIDSTSVADDQYARFTANGLEGRSVLQVKTDLSLNDVENTALSSWTGSSTITSLGTVSSGTWNASVISSAKIDSGITAGDVVKVDSTATDGQFAKFTANGLESTALAKADVGLSNVENTALSTWAGTSSITTLGTITAGEWKSSTKIADNYIHSASDWNTAVVNIGTLSDLDTDATGTLVAAIDELHGEINTNTTSISSNDTDIADLQTLADTHETAIGLNNDGTYTAIVDANYADGSSLKAAVTQLDTQAKTNADNIDLLEVRDGGLILQTTAKGIHMPATIMLSSHTGPFRVDFAQAIANNGAADLIFYGTKAKSHEDKFFTIDTTTGNASFTG